MIPETSLCIALKLATAWGLAPAGACVLDCNISHIYREAIPTRLVIAGPFGTCDRTTVGNTTDARGGFLVVRMDDGTWHWILEQDPVMCSQDAKP